MIGSTGDLVLYAHDIVQAERPVTPPDAQDGHSALRAALLAGGYAVAASSSSSNGWSLVLAPVAGAGPTRSGPATGSFPAHAAP